jgi:hypothetical protein
MTVELEVMARRYAEDGFCTSGPLISAAAVDALRDATEAVIRGDYDTGRAPHVTNAGADVPEPALVKVDQPHLANRAIAAAIRDPAIASWAAAVTGAQWLQVFAVQLLKKAPAGRSAGNVGWHQDDLYWSEQITGEAFTVWLALSDVDALSGPVQFVRGSHRWGRVDGGNFFDHDIEAQRQSLGLPHDAAWEPVAAVLSPGCASLHHRMVLHGSSENLGASPRRSLAIHMRSEKSTPIAGSYFGGVIEDAVEAPVVYGA